jgi:hypothetical protein
MFVVAGSGGVEKRVVMEREMESGMTDVVVNCFPLCCSTQTHCLKNYSLCCALS